MSFGYKYLICINIAAFVVYGYDKVASARELRRVSELALLVLALVGGSPAALVAMKLFRHKTRKDSFQNIFWLIVVAQAVVVILWTTFHGCS